MCAVFVQLDFWDCLHRMGRFISSYIRYPELLQLVGNCATPKLPMALTRPSTLSRCFSFEARLEVAKSETEVEHRVSSGIRVSPSLPRIQKQLSLMLLIR